MSQPPAAPESDEPIDYVRLCQPRPVPVLWGIDIVKVPDGEAQKLLAKLSLQSWNGEQVTYWPLETLGRLTKDLRGTMRIMSEAQTGLVTPGAARTDSGIILPGAG